MEKHSNIEDDSDTCRTNLKLLFISAGIYRILVLLDENVFLTTIFKSI